ncbi:hypothetical protein C7271_05000 [filamentous cyanobacterium CCP5]|nr:hypothetical protein C7271_05000 [filamentous cyanobacterium CCP5]
MADVFISYSRKDKAFVQALHKALTHSQYDVWVDWEDIPITADWWAEIQQGIDGADAFIFVISPASIESKVCAQEIDYAVTSHKRLIPILRAEGFDPNQMRTAVRRHNWLFFRPEDGFDQAFQRLVEALQTDLDQVRQHTRLLVRAKEWQQKDRHSDLLLRGQDLEESERWLVTAAEAMTTPTTLQQDFVFCSRQAERQRQRQERQRLQGFGAVVAGLALVATTMAIWAWQQRQAAIAQRQIAYEQRDLAQAQSKITFAHQLAAETAQAGTGRLSQRQDTITAQESQIAFDLATLPVELADLLRPDRPRMISFSPSKNYLATITQDYGLKVWQVEQPQPVLIWQDAARVVEMGFSPDSTLLTVATENGKLHIWRTGQGQFVPVTSLLVHDAPLTDTAFSPDGRYIATGSADLTIRVWDLASILNVENRQVTWMQAGGPISAVNFSPDGTYLVSASQDNAVRVWTMAGKNVLCIIHNQPLSLTRFSADGGELGSVSGDTLVRIWPWPRLIEAPQSFPEVRPRC